MDSVGVEDVQHREAPRAEETVTGIGGQKKISGRWLDGHEVKRVKRGLVSAAARLTRKNKVREEGAMKDSGIVK
jgi:hypothetical protein